MKITFLAFTAASIFFAISASATEFDQALDAGRVAAENFEKELSSQQKKIKIDAGNSGLVKYVYDRRNYSIGISRNKSVYVVVFSLKQGEGGRILGGGAKYEIEAETLKISGVVLYE